MSTPTPLVFLDLDGVVNACPRPKPAFEHRYGPYSHVEVGPCDDGRTYPVWYRPAVVAWLNSLHRSGLAEVLFLTTWQEEAQSRFAPAVGLDSFSVLTPRDSTSSRDGADWWKFKRVCEVLDSTPRPAVWLDDEYRRAVRLAFEARYDTPHLLVPVGGSTGLLDSDMATVEVFLESCRG